MRGESHFAGSVGRAHGRALTSSVNERTISIFERMGSPSGPSWSRRDKDPWDLRRVKQCER